MAKFYAGIGSRKTPPEILSLMTMLAAKLASNGYVLRSGGAVGADTAFHTGAGALAEIFTPDRATPKAMYLASGYHLNWDACSSYIKKLHGRNSMIILGGILDQPVSFVVCWTPDGRDSGGTGLAMRIAMDNGIPIVNLYHQEWLSRISTYLST